MQHFLKTPSRTTGTRIVASQFFDQFFVTVDNPIAAFNVRFGWIAVPPLTRPLEKKAFRQNRSC
jgi:hypothetical protein